MDELIPRNPAELANEISPRNPNELAFLNKVAAELEILEKAKEMLSRSQNARRAILKLIELRLIQPGQTYAKTNINKLYGKSHDDIVKTASKYLESGLFNQKTIDRETIANILEGIDLAIPQLKETIENITRGKIRMANKIKKIEVED
ncbi:MAG: hypothetical protein WCV72_05190 [Patescibacteria group bacterium]|jgi:hypothetical protein